MLNPLPLKINATPFSSQPSLRSGKVLASVQGSSETDESLVVCFGEMLIDFVPTINGLALAEAPAFKKAPVWPCECWRDEFWLPCLPIILKGKNVNNEGDGWTLNRANQLYCCHQMFAKDAGVLLSYDPNLRLPLWPSAESAREGILSIWDTADIIKISEEEIVFLTNGEDPYDDNVVRKLYHENLKLLLVTEGPDGCRYYTKEFSGRVKGIKVDPVDTTGVGDAFVAGVLSKIAADTSLLKDEKTATSCLRFANACGAITVTERGAIPALPTTEAVMNALLKTVA
ncbi:probable fructokinase-6, chloroplastic [Tanacetum coccineum]